MFLSNCVDVLLDVLDFKLQKTGFLSAIPYLAMAIVLQLSGHLADHLREKNILSTTHVRKIFNCGAFLCQTIFMTLTAFVGTSTGAVICLTIAVGLGGFAWSGFRYIIGNIHTYMYILIFYIKKIIYFSVNHLDIAPQHASVLMGIGNTIATLPGIISPILTGFIVQNKVVFILFESKIKKLY